MFYKMEKISENTYRFDKNGRANCYLIVGKVSGRLQTSPLLPLLPIVIRTIPAVCVNTTLEVWKTGANIVLEYMKQGYTAWIGHLDGRQTPEQLLVIMDMVDEIIAKKKNGQLTKKDSPYRRHDTLPEIRFNIENIY